MSYIQSTIRVLGICLLLARVGAANDKPNIIYIMTDDVGYGDVGCYGATHVRTPRIDRLAEEGKRFTDAHSTASVCTPTRYALLTGRYDKKIGDEPTGMDPGIKLKIKGDREHSCSVVNGIPRIGYMTGGHAARWVDEDIADTITARAVRFIDNHHDQPFFLYLSTHDIHEPMVPHPRFRGTSDCGWRGDVIHQLDWTVGQILDALDRHGLAANTLVIFTSDNGAAIKNTYDDGTNELHGRQRPNGALRGFKGGLYEGGHRVPFLVRWPKRIPSGGTSNALLGHVDTLATLANLVEQTLPGDAAPDSFNVLPAWLGQKTEKPCRDHLILQNNGPQPLALRRGDLVLIENNLRNRPKARPHELFDLSKDPAQTNDIADSESQQVLSIASLLQKLRENGGSRPGWRAATRSQP